MRLYYNLTTIYDLPPTMSAEIIKLRERAKGLLTVRFGRPFVSLLLAPKHTTNSSLPKLMPQYVDALQKTTDLARMQKLADAAETLRDRSKDPDTILASVLAVKTSVVSPSFGNFIGRKKKAKGTPKGKAKKKQTPPPSPKTTAKDNAKIIALEKEAEDCKEELQQVNTELLRLKSEKANIDADNKEKINELKQQIEKDEKKCKEQIEELKKKLEAAEKTNLKSVPNDKVEQMKKDAVKKIEENFESEKKTLEKRIEILQKEQTASTASVDAKISLLTKEKGDLEIQKSTLEKELKKLTISNSKLQASNRTLKGEKNALSNEKQTLQSAKDTLSKENQTLQSAKDKLAEEKTDLEKQLQKSTEEKEKLEKEFQKAKKVLLDVSKKITNKDLTIDQYDWANLNLKTAFVNFKQRMEGDLDKFKKENDSLRKQLREVEKTNKKLTQTIGKHKENVKNAVLQEKQKYATDNREQTKLLNRLTKAKNENQQLKNRIKRLEGKTSPSSGSGSSGRVNDASIDDFPTVAKSGVFQKDYEKNEIDEELNPQNISKNIENIVANDKNEFFLVVEKGDDPTKFKASRYDKKRKEYLQKYSRTYEDKYKIVYKRKPSAGRLASKQGPKMPVQDIELGDAFSEELVPALPKIHIPSREEMD